MEPEIMQAMLRSEIKRMKVVSLIGDIERWRTDEEKHNFPVTQQAGMEWYQKWRATSWYHSQAVTLFSFFLVM
ncbi:hypothetical protein SOVF_069450 [Spinacia oleracea]|nr:hypothetical protein SOVF_069450 [Spinacia oleracea]